MDYLVIARKYRPQAFAEVVGQEVIARTLGNAIRKQRIAHGFLFTGPSGVGKTTMARILAKALCCDTGPTAEPCGGCEHCRMIAESRHPDVFEIDAATHTGVDHVRELAEQATYAPTLARYRVYILDECHMLSAGAWNALLKLIEEPPPHVYFVFATTEVEKVPATVANRCQRFDFRAIDQSAVVARLSEVCQAEGVTVDEVLLARLARAAGGGMREAQTMLDQLIAMCEERISAEDIDLLLGAARSDQIADLLDAVAGERSAEALTLLDGVTAAGVSAATLLDQLAGEVRLMLLATTCGTESEPVRRLGGIDERLRALGERLGADALLRMGQILLGSQRAVRGGTDARVQLDLAIVHCARLGHLLDVEGLIRRIERLEASPDRGGALASPR